MNNTDPAVASQIDAGAPELLAYNSEIVPSIGSTLERCHLIFNIAMNNTNEIYVGACLWNVNETKFPFPNPSDDANSVDWFFWNLVTPWGPTAVIAPSGLYHRQLEFDIRSKRKVKEQAQTLMLFGAWKTTPGAGESFGILSSTLVKGGYS